MLNGQPPLMLSSGCELRQRDLIVSKSEPVKMEDVTSEDSSRDRHDRDEDLRSDADDDKDNSVTRNTIWPPPSSPSSCSSPRPSLFRPFPLASPNNNNNEALMSAFSPVSRLLAFRPFHSPVVAPTLFQPFLPSPSSSQQQSLKSANLPFSVDNILRPTFGHRSRLLSSSSSSCCSSPFLRSPPPSGSLASSPVKEEPKSSDDGVAGVDLTRPRSEAAAKGRQGEDPDDGVPPGMVRGPNGQLWPAWVFCTRYSDRPSSGECANLV